MSQFSFIGTPGAALPNHSGHFWYGNPSVYSADGTGVIATNAGIRRYQSLEPTGNLAFAEVNVDLNTPNAGNVIGVSFMNSSGTGVGFVVTATGSVLRHYSSGGASTIYSESTVVRSGNVTIRIEINKTTKTLRGLINQVEVLTGTYVDNFTTLAPAIYSNIAGTTNQSVIRSFHCGTLDGVARVTMLNGLIPELHYGQQIRYNLSNFQPTATAANINGVTANSFTGNGCVGPILSDGQIVPLPGNVTFNVTNGTQTGSAVGVLNLPLGYSSVVLSGSLDFSPQSCLSNMTPVPAVGDIIFYPSDDNTVVSSSGRVTSDSSVSKRYWHLVPIDSFTATANESNYAYVSASGYVTEIESINAGTVIAGSTGNTLIVRELSNVNRLTIDGVVVTDLTGTGNSYTFTAPDLLPGSRSGRYGTVFATASNDQGKSASIAIDFVPKATQSVYTLFEPISTVGSIGFLCVCTDGDQVVLDAPTSLNVAVHEIAPNGTIRTDKYDNFTAYHIRGSDGFVTELTVESPSESESGVRIVSVSGGTITAGSNANLSVTGFGQLTSVTINGIPVTNLTGSGSTYTFSTPDLAAASIIPAFGLVTVVATDGTLTDDIQVQFLPPPNMTSVTLTSVSTAEGSVGSFPGVTASVGDQFILSTPASLGVDVNRVLPAGGIFQSDHGGQQTIYQRIASTGQVVEISVTLPAAPVVEITPFTFTAVTNAAFGSLIESNQITIAGLTASANLTVANGLQYRINTGTGWSTYSTAPTTINNGHQLQVALTSSTQQSTAIAGAVTVGGYNTGFTVTTGIADVSPTPFTLTAVSNAALNTVIQSNTVTIESVSPSFPVPLTVSGLEYQIYHNTAWGSWSNAATTVLLNDQVRFRLTSSNQAATAVNGSVTVGSYNATFSVTTAAASGVSIQTVVLGVRNSWTATNFVPTAASIGGFNFTNVSATGFDASALAANQSFPLFGAQTLSVTNGTITLEIPVTLSPGASLVAVQQTNVSNSNEGYAKHYISTLEVGDRIVFPSPASLGVVNNGVNASGLIQSDVGGAQTWFLQKATTGQVTSIPVTFPDIAVINEPTPFTFNAITNAAFGSLIESNQITIAGLTLAANLTVSGALQYRINTGGGWSAYSTAPTTVLSGHQVQVAVNSSVIQNTATTGTVNVGTYSTTFTATTGTADVTPQNFSLMSVSNAALSTLIQANTVTIAGVSPNFPVPLTVSGLEYQIYHNGVWGSWSNAATTVLLDDMLRLRLTSSNLPATAVNGSVTVGTFTTTFSVTTALNTVVTPITIAPSTNQQLNTYIETAPYTIAGVSVGANVAATTTNCQIAVLRNSVWTNWSTSVTLALGEQFKLRLVTGVGYSQTTNASVSLNGVSYPWVVTTRIDTDPDAFTLAPVVNAMPDRLYVSNEILVGGIVGGVSIPITPSNCEISVDGGPWVSTPTTVQLNGRFVVRLRTGVAYASTYSGTVNLNGVIRSFNVTVGAAPSLVPTDIVLSNTVNAPLNTDVVSQVFSVLGISAGYEIPITVTNGEYAVNTGGAWEPFTTLPGEVGLGNQIQLRTTSPGSYGGSKVVTANINGVEFTWEVISRATPDITPNVMVFPRVTNAVKGAEYETIDYTVAGADAGIDMSLRVVNGQYVKNGQTATSEPGLIRLGDTVKLIANASMNGSTNKRVILTIGGTQSTWEIATAADPQGTVEASVVKEIANIEPKVVDITATGVVGKTL
jgi:LEA14-like dessication related protein